MEFSNKTALITGASRGIGKAVALLMAEQGADLILLDIDADELRLTAEEAERFGGKVLFYPCDVSNEQQINQVIGEAENTFGKIDILVNNAAIFRDTAPFETAETALWRKYLDVNVMGVVYCTKAVLGGMIRNNYGRIINVGSVAGIYGNRKMVHYSATKGAVIAMTKALAKEVAEQGIRVNCVSPGTVTSSKHNDIDLSTPNDMNYLGRTGSDRENAELICFLAGDRAAYITGQNIQIDGCRKLQ